MSEMFLLTVAGVIAVLAGLTFGYRVLGQLWANRPVSPNNAHQLLAQNKPEMWNEVRRLYPNWRPDLSHSDLSRRNLPNVDLRNANLEYTLIRNSYLDGADFSGASLRGASLKGSALDRALFVETDLRGADFSEATLFGAYFDRANTRGAKIDPKHLDDSIARASRLHGMQQIEFIAESPDYLQLLNPREFEELVSQVMLRRGYVLMPSESETIAGYDFIASDFNQNETYVVECKAYQNNRTVGVSALRSLYAAKLQLDIRYAMLVTSSRFSADAITFAESFRDITLIDQRRLLGWIREIANPHKE